MAGFPEITKCNYSCNPKDGAKNPIVDTPNPIDVLSGNKQFEVEDFANASRTLVLARISNSLPYSPVGAIVRQPVGLATWRYDFQFELQLSSWGLASGTPHVVLLTPGGASPTFQINPASLTLAPYTAGGYPTPQTEYALAFVGTWPSDLSTLAYAPTTWTLTDSDDTVYTLRTVEDPYAPGLFDIARPIAITRRDGTALTLTYDTVANYNVLLSMADSFGNAVSFTYLPSPPSGVPPAVYEATLPGGHALKYTYSPVLLGTGTSQPDLLTKVDYLDAGGISRDSTSYQYGAASCPYAVTGVFDVNTVQRWGVTYDPATCQATVSSVTGAASAVKAYQVAYTTVPAPGAGGTFTRTVTNPLGKVSVYTYANDSSRGIQLTGVGNLASPHSPASTESYAYGSDGFVASHIDLNGITETFEITPRDPRGMPTQTVEGAAPAGSTSRTTNFAWDPAWHEPDTVTVPTLTQTAYAYNSFGAVTSKTLTDLTTFTTPYPTNGRTRTWTFDWNGANELAAIHGPRWTGTGTVDTASFGYNGAGYLTSVSNALGQTTSITSLDWRGAPLTAVDPNSVSMTFVYDIHGRLTQAILNPGATQSEYQFAYDAVGDLAQVTLPMGAMLTYQWDAGRRLVSVTNTRNETRTYTYDNKDDPLTLTTKTSTSATTQSHAATYDEWGRILQSIGSASQTWNLAYDNLDNLLSVTDPPVSPNPGAVRANTYDSLNRLVKQTDPETHFVQYGYDLADALDQLTDARSLVTNRVVDGFGEVIEEASPDRGTLTYYYDLSGNPTKRLDGGGIETDLAYDNANRLVSKCWPSEAMCTGTISGGPGQEAYTYDQTAGGNAGVGRLTSVVDEAGSTALTYDAHGRVTQDTRVVTGFSSALAVGYVYDLNGKVTQITYPSGDVVNYARTTDGLITGVTFKPSGGSAVNIATSVAYEPFGPLTTLAYGNGLYLTRTYDQDYQLTGVAVAPSSGPAVLNLGFGWQTDGRISTVSGTNVGNSMAATYTYTPSGRVLTANGPWASATVNYAYDPSGNLTLTGPPAAPVTVVMSTTSNQAAKTIVGGATQRTFTYGADGDLSIDQTVGAANYKYLYNAAQRMVGAQKNVTPPVPFGAYAYGFAGQRVWRQTYTGGGSQTAYVFDRAGHVLAEADAVAGAPSREYIWLDDRLIGMATFSGGAPTTRFVTTGQIDEPLLVTSNNQSAYWNGWVDPYGTAATIGTSLSRLNLRFPGQWLQAEASNGGLSQNGWRDYDPTLGKYIEADPLGINAGASLYAYVNGDPLNLRDAKGALITFTGSPAGNAALEAAYSEIGSTSTGAELEAALNSSPIQYQINDWRSGQSYYDPPTKIINVDPNYHPITFLDTGKQCSIIPASTVAQLAHELGHAREPLANEAGIVNDFENPIREELNMPIREFYAPASAPVIIPWLK